MNKKKTKKSKEQAAKTKESESMESLQNQGIPEVDWKKMMGCGG